MKRMLTCTVLAVLFGLQASLAMAKAVSTPESWEYLQPDRDQVIASLNVVELLKRHHYNKPPLNDARSAKILTAIQMLDPSRSYFLASDLEEFGKWRSQFDDFLKGGNLEPGFTIYKRHLERLQNRLNYALSLLDKGVDHFDFTIDEELLVDREKAAWAKDAAELDDLWRKRVRMKCCA